MVTLAHPSPNGISMSSVVFAGLMTVTDLQTDRPTDHATRSVTIGRSYILPCGLKTGKYKTECKGDRVVAVKQQVSLWNDST